ncbi:MAG: CoA pyrophosphatase [Anaerolineales bacterium]|nr:CoA pyrophosphatase [Anaerolineales bacterium]
MKDAAVLVPLYRDANGRFHLVLVQRSAGGNHAGQLAFPGGKRDAADASLLATALREAHEEIGLPPAHVQLLAELPVAETRTSGFRIAPFLARIVPPPGGWRPHPREIAAVLDVPLADLLAPGAHDDTPWQLPAWPAPRCEPCYHVGPHRLWGVTYRILHPLLPRLRAEEWV